MCPCSLAIVEKQIKQRKLEKHSESADLRQAAPFPHTMIPTKRTVLYLFHFYEPSLKSL